MPMYWYRCDKCKEEFSAFHRMSETVDSCKICDHKSAPAKLVTKPLRKKKGLNTIQVGDITKEYIKANKEILENEKKKRKKEDT
jgi:putative FmdB family regulatory protein